MLSACLSVPRTPHTAAPVRRSALRLGRVPRHPLATLHRDGPRVFALLRALDAPPTVLTACGLQGARRTAFLGLCRALRAAAQPARAVLDLTDFDMDIAYLTDMHESLPEGDVAGDLVLNASTLRDLHRDVTTCPLVPLTPAEQDAYARVENLRALTRELAPASDAPPPGFDVSDWTVPHVLLCPARTQADAELVRELHGEAEQNHWMMGEDPRPHATYVLTSEFDRVRYVRLTQREARIERAFTAAVAALQELMTPEGLERSA